MTPYAAAPDEWHCSGQEIAQSAEGTERAASAEAQTVCHDGGRGETCHVLARGARSVEEYARSKRDVGRWTVVLLTITPSIPLAESTCIEGI